MGDMPEYSRTQRTAKHLLQYPDSVKHAISMYMYTLF